VAVKGGRTAIAKRLALDGSRAQRQPAAV